MLFNRAEMLNRRASQPKFRVNEIMKVLAMPRGARVADIGCGGGFFTMKFAERVGLDGKVYAVDKNKKFLTYIEKQAQEKQITNIKSVLIKEKGIELPEQSCDLIFLRNVFHHIEDPTNYFKSMKIYLKPKGKVAIIDYKKCAAFNFITLMGHYVKEELIQKTMKDAGYLHIARYEFLPEQSFNIFELT